MELILIPIIAIMNRLRGWEKFVFNDIFFALSGAITMGLLTQNVWVYLIMVIGLMVWSCPRWGFGFAVITGRYKPTKNGILEIIIKIFPTQNGYFKGWLYMSLRGLYALPLFIGLSFFTWQYAWICGFAMFAQGSLYMLGRPEREVSVPLAEIITGAYLGGLLALCVFLRG